MTLRESGLILEDVHAHSRIGEKAPGTGWKRQLNPLFDTLLFSSDSAITWPASARNADKVAGKGSASAYNDGHPDALISRKCRHGNSTQHDIAWGVIVAISIDVIEEKVVKPIPVPPFRRFVWWPQQSRLERGFGSQ